MQWVLVTVLTVGMISIIAIAIVGIAKDSKRIRDKKKQKQDFHKENIEESK